MRNEPEPTRPASRLTLLLSCPRQGSGPVVDQLPRLLEPLGIGARLASTGNEATQIIEQEPVHIAMVDLATPLHERDRRSAGGGRVLQILRRLDAPPPTVIVRPRQAAARDSARSLSEALREGAFAVIDQPLQLETLLEVMRRIVRRHYADHWPAA